MNARIELIYAILMINIGMNGVCPTTYYEFYEETMTGFSQVDESLKDTIKAAVAAGLLGAAPISMYGKDNKIGYDTKKAATGQLPPAENVLPASNNKNKLSAKDVKIGQWDRSKLINIVARTLFMEAREDYKNGGLKAVASVIWNRAGRKPENVVSVCFTKNQFSVWISKKPWENADYKPNSYVSVTPPQVNENSIEKAAWNECVKFATEMADGTFVSNIGKRNMYDRERTEKNKSWFDVMKDKMVVGSQTFGYLETAGKTSVASKKPNIYIVKSGDSLTRIATKNKVSYADLLKKNPKYSKNPNSIKVGDKVILPEKKNG